MTEATEIHEEFSRIFSTDDFPPLGRNIKLSATDEECVALAERFNILSCSFLKVNLKVIVKNKGRRATAAGRLQAKITQACGVTLEPIVEKIDIPLSLLFLDEESLDKHDYMLDVEEDISDEDIADPIVRGNFDVGAAVSENFAMAINPYPRKADAELSLPNEDFVPEEDVPVAKNPFAVLSALKDQKG